MKLIDQINIAELQYSTKEELGPGKRYLLWVQGCPFSCPFCIAPVWIPNKPNKIMARQELVETFLSADIEGLTLSGGEPFGQAHELAKLCAEVRQHKEINVIAFSGFKLQQLQKGSLAQRALLSQVDVLIDGQYEAAKNESKGLRGSSNQQIHFLTHRLETYEALLSHQPRRMNTYPRPNGESLMVGIPPQGISYKFLNHLINL